MMRAHVGHALMLLVGLSAALLACGSSEVGVEDGSHDPASAFTDGTSAGTPGGDVTPQSACVTATSAGQSVPAYLVFMFDRSDSMAKDGKWTSCAKGLEAFFGDASTAGLSASLHFFPQYVNGDVSCGIDDYAAPAVPMRVLPDGRSFAAAIDATKLLSSTPTLPAIEGAVAYGQRVKSSHPGAKLAIVLVTDGLPSHCNSSVQTVSDVAQAAASTLPTYVIGVGTSGGKEAEALANLNSIASAGGTGKAIMVDTSTPDQLAADFEGALGQVKASATSCELKIPAAPPGQVLDVHKVNVSLTTGGGQSSTLVYDSSCAGGQGWHYDDASTPSKIVLCPRPCDAVKNDTASKVTILLGCAVNGTIK